MGGPALALRGSSLLKDGRIVAWWRMLCVHKARNNHERLLQRRILQRSSRFSNVMSFTSGLLEHSFKRTRIPPKKKQRVTCCATGITDYLRKRRHRGMQRLAVNRDADNASRRPVAEIRARHAEQTSRHSKNLHNLNG